MFIFNANTLIEYQIASIPVHHGVEILRRDMKKVLKLGDYEPNKIELIEDKTIGEEQYIIVVTDEVLTIKASDDLGFIYGLLFMSEHFLGIKPFWFWMDQETQVLEQVAIEEGEINSPHYAVKYRGWFFNDEVLLMKWQINGDSTLPWKMAYEALLRCGGNMAIPATDKNGVKNRRLASDMGLWITHHHAEPLGAEMFARAYPGKVPSYSENKALFIKLWEEAVLAQKDMKVIYNLGFRGQGDCPFWEHDQSGQYNTDEKRGALISELIAFQKEIVKKYVDKPVFCTNLYGEIMELYSEGYVHLDEDIIKIYADNGYGKMVSRRRDNHKGRIEALPQSKTDTSGIYYHASFYDLQAANHITMLPNSIDFVNKELNTVMAKGADAYWMINCSNIRPHVYYLDAIRKKWQGEELIGELHSKAFTTDYFEGNEQVAWCYNHYAKVMPQYGQEEDEHAGEQFYNENVRLFCNHIIRHQEAPLKGVYWCTGEKSLKEQVKVFGDIVRSCLTEMTAYYEKCEILSQTLTSKNKKLFDATIGLHTAIHYYCMKGLLSFERGCNAFWDKAYKEAFMALGESAEWFEKADSQLYSTTYDVWEGFYANECFADIKHTTFMVRKLMGVVREYGDNPRHYDWYRKATYPPEDREIYTLLINDNHMTDLELYEVLKKQAVGITI